MSEALNDLVQNQPLQPGDNPVLQGNFGPVSAELTFAELEVLGTIPEDLCHVLNILRALEYQR